jgi:hypothetical protein
MQRCKSIPDSCRRTKEFLGSTLATSKLPLDGLGATISSNWSVTGTSGGEKVKAQLRVQMFNVFNNINRTAQMQTLFDGKGNLVSAGQFESSATWTASGMNQFQRVCKTNVVWNGLMGATKHYVESIGLGQDAHRHSRMFRLSRSIGLVGDI